MGELTVCMQTGAVMLLADLLSWLDTGAQGEACLLQPTLQP